MKKMRKIRRVDCAKYVDDVVYASDLETLRGFNGLTIIDTQRFHADKRLPPVN